MFHWFWLWPLWIFAPFHGLLSLLVLVLIVWLIFGRHHHPYYGYSGPGPAKGRSEALDILEGRYARGEIQRDEYLQKKQDLGG